jgi:hypothetical protein
MRCHARTAGAESFLTAGGKARKGTPAAIPSTGTGELIAASSLAMTTSTDLFALAVPRVDDA